MELLSKLLILNPEHYTVWNHRRRHLQDRLASADVTTKQQLIRADLDFLLPLLIKYPKCYWIWNHRWWLLEQGDKMLTSQQAREMWREELQLDSKMLARDSRNFHGWGYRRQIIQKLEIFEEHPVYDSPSDSAKVDSLRRCRESEFEYTTTMITQNLSNFSAWHNRSRLIHQVLDRRNASSEDRRVFFESELALIDDAICTDPYDQSLWFYHQYLMSTMLNLQEHRASWVKFSSSEQTETIEEQMAVIRELLDDTTDCKWIYQNLLQLWEQRNSVHDVGKLDEVDVAQQWLAQLRKLDPLRRGRWLDWEHRLFHHARELSSLDSDG